MLRINDVTPCGVTDVAYGKQYISEVICCERKLIINKKSLKGEDGYKVFSIRIKEATVERLDSLASKTNRSRNELINILIDYAIENCKVE